MSNIIQTAQSWLNQDPDTETCYELQALIDANNIAELEKRFSGRLQFGTAGLRGALQAGPMGMNRVLVAQAAAGLARFILNNFSASENSTETDAKPSSSNKQPSIVIGYDARKNSKIFAEDTAEIMQGMGITAHIMPDLRPTPVLAFAVRELNASAGVMVTASHNPPEDNGYKVYLGSDDAETNGTQIVPPVDQEIAEQIQWVADNLHINELSRCSDYHTINHSVIDAYIEETVKVKQSPASEVSYVYTAMHGVGTQTLLTTLERAGLPLPILVNEQCTPDGTFPTVSFPNPEEVGALDLAIAKAKVTNAEFIIANDPDADRLAVAVPVDVNNTAGDWATLHGNEIGLYLAWHIAKQVQAAGKTGVLGCSLVSSPALAKVAQACGMQHQETLTGFKWIGLIPNLIFGFEEALGYLVNPENVRDKDGISAIISFLDLINELKADGKTFAQYRQEFTETFGALYSDQISIRVEDLDLIGRVLTAVRNKPFTDIAGMKVTQYVDHLTTSKNNNILVFYVNEENADDVSYTHRVIFRPSGTEPKLKIYLDTEGKSLVDAKQASVRIKQALESYLKQIS